MKTDKTYSELWELVNDNNLYNDIRETAKLAIGTLDKLHSRIKELEVQTEGRKWLEQYSITELEEEITSRKGQAEVDFKNAIQKAYDVGLTHQNIIDIIQNH